MRKVINWSITLPSEMEKDLERVMKIERRGKSDLVREALRHYIDELKWRETYRYFEKRARKLGITEKDVVGLVHETRKEKNA